MTEEDRHPQRKPPRPALASRILAVGASAAATIGLVGAMVARSAAPTTATSAAAPSSQPVRIVVVIKRPNTPQSTGPSVTRAPSVSAGPQIIRRYVSAPALTTTHGS